MRPVLAPLVLLALAPFAFALPLHEGPYAGVVPAGASATHAFDNFPPPPEPCPQSILPSWYTVTLSYAPPTARVVLDVEGVRAVEGADGVAHVGFREGDCIRKALTVTNLEADAPVAYTLVMTRGSGGPVEDA